MIFRLAANMFATQQGAVAMLDSERLPITSDVIAESVLSSDASCRQAGSTLAYNCSLYLNKSNGDIITQVHRYILSFTTNTNSLSLSLSLSLRLDHFCSRACVEPKT